MWAYGSAIVSFCILPPLVLLLYPLWLVTSLLSLHSEVLSKKVSLDSFLADVYERLTKKGEKPGFMQLLAAQVTSAVWHVCSFPCPQISHLLQLKKKISLFYLSNRMLGIWVEQGLYPGYILFFVNTAFMITGARGKHWTYLWLMVFIANRTHLPLQFLQYMNRAFGLILRL